MGYEPPQCLVTARAIAHDVVGAVDPRNHYGVVYVDTFRIPCEHCGGERKSFAIKIFSFIDPGLPEFYLYHDETNAEHPWVVKFPEQTVLSSADPIKAIKRIANMISLALVDKAAEESRKRFPPETEKEGL